MIIRVNIIVNLYSLIPYFILVNLSLFYWDGRGVPVDERPHAVGDGVPSWRVCGPHEKVSHPTVSTALSPSPHNPDNNQSYSSDYRPQVNIPTKILIFVFQGMK